MNPSFKTGLLEVFRQRHACHLFRTDRHVARADIDFILEAGRLSPSSFGLEQWKFVVLTSPTDRQRLQGACFEQPQVGTASCDIVLLAKIAEMHPDSDYVRQALEREYPGERLAPALANYRGFHANTDVAAWSIAQCHIAAANMMTASAALGIDSCPIGGFLPEPVKKLLKVEAGRHEIALILALGYCAEPAGEKMRLPLAELAEYR